MRSFEAIGFCHVIASKMRLPISRHSHAVPELPALTFTLMAAQ